MSEIVIIGRNLFTFILMSAFMLVVFGAGFYLMLGKGWTWTGFLLILAAYANYAYSLHAFFGEKEGASHGEQDPH